ncbi:hypothetical protein EON65_42015, partial [archaeon]
MEQVLAVAASSIDLDDLPVDVRGTHDLVFRNNLVLEHRAEDVAAGDDLACACKKTWLVLHSIDVFTPYTIHHT